MRIRRDLIFIGIIGIIAALMAFVLVGCADPHRRPTDASVKLGEGIKGAWGHTESAEYNIQQARKAVIGPANQAFIDAASHEHSAVFEDLTVAGVAHDKVNKQFNDLARKVERMESSDRWRYGGYVVMLRTILVVWAIVIITFPIIATFVSGPVGTVIGFIGRFANPLAWGQWYAEKKRVNEALLTPVPSRK